MPRGFRPPRPSNGTPAHADASILRRIFCSDLRWLAGLTWARVGWICALAMALALRGAPEEVLEIRHRFDVPIATYAYAFLFGLPDHLVTWLVLLLLATAADNLPLRGTMRKLALALALALGVLAFPAEECLLLPWLNDVVCADFPSTYFADLFALGGRWQGLYWTGVIGAIVGIIWFSYRRDAATAAALHAVALERNRLQRRTLDASLKARQARVEPDFLLDIVNTIAASCEHDSDRAERMIDELVSYLRAALPDDRKEASTLGRELRMIEAYLALISLRTGERVRRAIDVPTPLLAMQIAPALLLPLVSGLVPHRSVVPTDGIDVRIEAMSVGEQLRVLIARNGGDPGAAPNPLVLTDLRVRLRDLYGEAASLTVDAAAGADARAVLMLPRALEQFGERKAAADEGAAALEAPFDPAYQGA
ncbi:MAG TPA: histidine kinase [Casimicrobiaceae bacterium]|nr:histidine kinase [Casimicrobiaceae bacterium]